MSLSSVPTRSLVGELARRAARRLPPALVPGRLAAAPVPTLDTTVFGVFERDDGRAVPLWSGYRTSLKGGWRGAFWPVRALLELAERAEVRRESFELVRELRSARTLSVPLAELAKALEAEALEHADLFWRSSWLDPETGTPVLRVRPTDAELERRRDYYSATASGPLRHSLRAAGVDLAGARVLEIGCGTGYLPFAAAALGARRSVGVDIHFNEPEAALERPQLPRLFGDSAAEVVELMEADGEALPFEEGSFDAVYSFSTVEHVRDPVAMFAEVARVLRSGGISRHAADPWFSPSGGHALCSLDFPWGHVRLSETEFERYVREFRPHELGVATGSYRGAFSQPRRALGEIEGAMLAAGLVMVESSYDSHCHPLHREILDGEVLADCLRGRGAITVRDLLTDTHVLVGRKR